MWCVRLAVMAILASIAQIASASELSQEVRCTMTVDRSGDNALVTLTPLEEESWIIDLERHSSRAADYRAVLMGADGASWPARQSEPSTYRGSIRGIPGSMVVMSLPEDDSWLPTGAVALPSGANWSICAVGPEEVCLTDGISSGFECAVDPVHFDQGVNAGSAGTSRSANRGATSVARIGVEVDHEYVLAYGPDIGAVEARIETIMSMVNMQYDTQVDIFHEIVVLVIWIDAMDPYSGSHSNRLQQFASRWDNSMQHITRDMAVLSSGLGQSAGLAMGIGVVCSEPGLCYAVAARGGPGIPFLEDAAVVSHELGHLWGGMHCCPGHTMQPGQFHLNFAQETRDRIAVVRNVAAPCLTSPPDVGSAPFPLSDSFGAVLSPVRWTGIDGAEPSMLGINPPSPPYALNLTGRNEVRSANLDATSASEVVVTYSWQRGGGGDRPQVGDDLVLAYFAANKVWVDYVTHPGGVSDQVFMQETITLPSDALHDQLRIKFRTTSDEPGMDDYFIDDVCVRVSNGPSAPSSATQLMPTDDATGITLADRLGWVRVEDACCFEVLVSESDDFATMAGSYTSTDSDVGVGEIGLALGKSYCWKVLATNAMGTTESAVWRFSTAGYQPGECPGDATGDGRVNFDDLNVVLDKWGTDGSEGGDVAPTGGGDGSVDFLDLGLVLEEFDTVCH